ncbi:MAG: hypothetical protein AAB408_03075 [Patescibacteria group bacterium]
MKKNIGIVALLTLAAAGCAGQTPVSPRDEAIREINAEIVRDGMSSVAEPIKDCFNLKTVGTGWASIRLPNTKQTIKVKVEAGKPYIPICFALREDEAIELLTACVSTDMMVRMIHSGGKVLEMESASKTKPFQVFSGEVCREEDIPSNGGARPATSTTTAWETI